MNPKAGVSEIRNFRTSGPFPSLDDAPVHNIVLFIVPKKEYHLHLRTLAAIAKLFTNREVRQRLADAESREQIHEIFASRPARA